MGSIQNTGALAAFRGSLYNYGLSLVRCDIRKALGIWKANDSATFRQGQFVMLDATQQVVLTDGQNVLGVSKWNKITTSQAIQVDEQIVFPSAGSAVTVQKPQSISAVSIRSAPAMGGTQYTGGGTDYSFATNGVITQNGAGAIPTGTVVYITYTYQMLASDNQADGFNFFNSLDDVTLQEDRITVITDWSLLFTAEYDTAQQYTLQGAGSNLYVTGATYANGGAGILTNVAPTNYVPASGNGVGRYMGKVIQLPSASDGFLGVMLGGNPAAVQAAGAPGVLV